MLFSVAKAEWTKSRDKFERETGQVVTKETFLKVFGEAYIAAFTPENNRKAFKKTGVHPFNRSAIDPRDLAPAMEHSVHAHLPLNVPSPVKAMMEIYRSTLRDIQDEKDRANGWETGDEDPCDNDDSNGGASDDDDDDGDDNGSEPDTPDRGAGDVQRALLHVGPTRSISASKSPPSPLPGHPIPAPRTPAYRRLRNTFHNASPTRALVNGTPSRTPAPVPARVFLRPSVEVNWNALPRPAADVYDELEMVRDELAKARQRDEQYAVCLDASNSQLAVVGCWAETCRNHAVAARSRRGKKGGRRVCHEGRSRIITDADFLADMERNEMERRAADAAKKARQDARKDKEAIAVIEKQYKDGRAQAWKAAKEEHILQVAKWEEGGRVGLKPKLPKRKDVWRDYDMEHGRLGGGTAGVIDASEPSSPS